MTTPLGMTDFFALEANECLTRLETLLGQEPLAGDELARTARALRGSALMANQRVIARAAAGLEALARALRDRHVSWDGAMREQACQSIEEFRLLVRRVPQWSDADAARGTRLGESLEALAGGAAAPRPARLPSVPAELTSGVRAFIVREGALVASALDRAASAVRTTPDDREPLYAVIRHMQSLRGLAEVSELSPLPDILDGVELAIGDLTRLFAPPMGVDAVLYAASQALTRASRDVADDGRPTVDSPEARRFTELLLRIFAIESDVVPIESLLAADHLQPASPDEPGPHFSPQPPLGPLELVSHGEHLCQTADVIAGARSAAQRDLRLYGLVSALRAIPAHGATPVGVGLASFAAATRARIAADVARDSGEFTAWLTEAGGLLRSVADGANTDAIGRRLQEIAERPWPSSPPAQSDTVPDMVSDVVPDIVPIESLAYDGEDLTGAAVVPIESLAPDAEPAIDVAEICYRGRAALERAGAVRDEIAAQLGRRADLGAIQSLLDELLDLVPLALDKPR